MPPKKIVCALRKQPKCLEAPEHCVWDATINKCKNVTPSDKPVAKPHKPSVATKPQQKAVEDPLQEYRNTIANIDYQIDIVKELAIFIGKMKILQTFQILMNGLFQKHFEFPSTDKAMKKAISDYRADMTIQYNHGNCIIQSVHVYKSHVPSNESLLNQAVEATNLRLHTLYDMTIKNASKEIMTGKLPKLSLHDMYFVTECLNIHYGYIGFLFLYYSKTSNECLLLHDMCRGLKNNNAVQKASDLFNIPVINIPSSLYIPDVTSSTISNALAKRYLQQFLAPNPKRLNHNYFDVMTSTLEKYRTPAAIRHYYVNVVGSTELNVSIIQYLNAQEVIPNDILKRTIGILQEYNEIDALPKKYSHSFIAYHGTTQEIHRSKTFSTAAFLSTTRSVETAFKYAGYYGGVIYIMKIPAGFPFINFNDQLQQILLPIGTTIKVNKVFSVDHTRYVYCDVLPYDVTLTERYLNIFKYPCFIEYDTSFKNPTKMHIKIPQKSSIVHQKMDIGSSVFYSTNVGRNTYYIKDIVKKSNKVRVLRNGNQVLKRIMNELMAADVYANVYNLATLEMFIFDKNSHNQFNQSFSNASDHLLASKKSAITYHKSKAQDNAQMAIDILKGFVVDCIMSNWDAYNNKNVGIDRSGNIVRTDVGGALGYRGRGDEKLQFIVGVEPNEHILLAGQVSFLDLLQRSRYRTDDIVTTIKTYMASVKDISSRLDQVRTKFYSFIDEISDKNLNKIYKDYVDHILQVVEYRHKWYIDNLDQVLKMTFKKSGGSSSFRTPETPREEVEATPTVELPETGQGGSMGFTMTPDELKNMFAKFEKCQRTQQPPKSKLNRSVSAKN